MYETQSIALFEKDILQPSLAMQPSLSVICMAPLRVQPGSAQGSVVGTPGLLLFAESAVMVPKPQDHVMPRPINAYN